MTSDEYSKSLQYIQTKVVDARNAGTSKKEINDLKAEMEFDLNIEYFLGSDFSADRRQLLRDVHRSMRQSLMLAIGRSVRGETSPVLHDTEVRSITKIMVNDFANILSPEELKSFVGRHAESSSDTFDYS